MSFIAKNPISAAQITSSPPVPLKGTRGIFAKEDGWYEIDDQGNVRKLGSEKKEVIGDINFAEGRVRSAGVLDETDTNYWCIYQVPVSGDVIFDIDTVSDNVAQFFCYNSNKELLTEWNEGYSYAWKPFPVYLKGLPSETAYVSINVKKENFPTAPTLIINKGCKQIYFADHGYSIYGASIDDEKMHKLVINSKGKDDNEYAILELCAPEENAAESTICLMNKDEETLQFVDFSSMVYNPDNPTVEIVCQTRGGHKLPEFSVRFNDGKGAGRVKKFAVHPDAIPMEMTKDGLKVRKNNNFNNTGTDEEYIIVNLESVMSRLVSIEDNLEVFANLTDEETTPFATKEYIKGYVDEAILGGAW